MYVNIESTDPGVNLDELSLNFSLDLSMLSQIDTANVAYDTGGITGYSSGTVDNCELRGHRSSSASATMSAAWWAGSSGAVKNCSNEGSVCGRKDVGGIVGQMEPYVQVALSGKHPQQAAAAVDELLSSLTSLRTMPRAAQGGVLPG